MWNDIEKIVGVLAGGRGKRTKTTLGSITTVVDN